MIVKVVLALVVFVSMVAAAANPPPPPRDNKQELGSRPAIRVIGRINREEERKAIRVIGRGGGYAEMKALTALAQLKVYFTPCLLDPKLCGLSKEAHEYLLSLDARGELNTQKAILEFFTDLESEDTYRYDNNEPNRMAMSTKLIYNSSGKSRPYHEIVSAVFEGWFFLPNGKASVATRSVFLEIQSIFENVTLVEKEQKLGFGLTLRQMNVDAFGNTSVLLAVESEKETSDITSFINESLSNLTPSADLTNVVGMFVDSGYIILRVRWSSGENLFEGRIHIKINDPQKEMKSENLTIHIVSVTELDCEGKVGGK